MGKLIYEAGLISDSLKFSGGLDAYLVSYTEILESSRLVRRNVLVIKLPSRAQA